MLQHEQVLITGATGFLGGAVLHQALKSHHPHRWIALVRGRDEAEAREKLIGRLSRFAGRGEAERLAGRVEILLGSLETLASLDPAPFAAVTRILHLAADTSFSAKVSPWKVNFDGTMQLAEFARSLPNLRRLVYVGTATICGAEPPQLVTEESYPSFDVDHLVEYTRSKAAAECILRQRYPDLPVVVARPSIVIGHTRLGVRPSSSIFWFIRFAEALGLVPGTAEDSVDIVPVDWVASALTELLTRQSLAHDTYHLSAGIRAATTWAGIAQGFASFRGAATATKLEPIDFERSDNIDLLRARIIDRFGFSGRPLRHILKAALGYYRFCELDVVFDNSRLLKEGIAGPPMFTDYLATCLGSAPKATVLEQFLDDAEMFDDAPTPAFWPNTVLAATRNPT